jgi:N-acetylmuramoyl-L-alanine amidase
MPEEPSIARRRAVGAWLGLALFLVSINLWPGGGGGNGPGGASSAPANGAGPVTVVLDPGHGGMDSGASAQGVVEKELTLDVATRVARLLAASGIRSRLTRVDDRYVPLATRVRIANSLPGALFVSIHFNDAPPEGRDAMRVSGIETFYSPAREEATAGHWIWTSMFGGTNAAAPDPAESVRKSALLADCIQRTLIEDTSAADRGVKAAGLYVTRRVLAPAVLVEGGFVSHPREAHLLNETAYRERIAEAVAGGILRYLRAAQPPLNAAPARA